MSHTTTDTPALPAAWYRDPSGRHERRWWDGAEWTDRVADGEVVGSDPPVRSRPAEDPVDTSPAGTPPDGTGADDAAASDADGAPTRDPLSGLDHLKPERRAAARAAADGDGLSKRTVALWVATAAAIVLALGWGLHNYRVADQWRDRGEALETELATSESNADALEDALGEAASRGAGLQDGQEFFAELRGAAAATVDQLNACASSLNDILEHFAVSSGDPGSLIDRANRTCGEAGLNGETLIALLDQLE